MKYEEWIKEIDDDLFLHDVRATLDGVEAGQMSVKFVNSWLKGKGYTINWATYELTKETK
jgi:hypothetical protein